MNTIKINELKVGDRVKYEFPFNSVLDICSKGEGIIEFIEWLNPIKIKLDRFSWSFDSRYIISKIELVPDSHPGSYYYQEIPIEKENNLKHDYSKDKHQNILNCEKCGAKSEALDSCISYYVCKNCASKDKYPYYNEEENIWILKEESTPKSHKFDIIASSYDYWIHSKPPWMEFGKRYTVEIKEKE